MKAKDYYDKYGEQIIAEAGTEKETSGALYHLLMDFINEIESTAKARHTKSDKAVFAICKELNQKWNALANIFVKKKGYEVLLRDGFKQYITKEIPELKKQW